MQWKFATVIGSAPQSSRVFQIRRTRSEILLPRRPVVPIRKLYLRNEEDDLLSTGCEINILTRDIAFPAGFYTGGKPHQRACVKLYSVLKYVTPPNPVGNDRLFAAVLQCGSC